MNMIAPYQPHQEVGGYGSWSPNEYGIPGINPRIAHTKYFSAMG